MSDRTVLHIEDNEYNRKIVRQLLSRTTYRLLEAADGEEGLAVAKRELPDLILMDVQLPGIDGIEALGRIRADERTVSIPVVALTAQAMTGDRERFLDSGFDGYISKPVDVVEFLETVGRYCEGTDG